MRGFDAARRTETDLYLYVMDNLHYLREQYGPQAPEPEKAVEDLKRSRTERSSLIGRLKRRGERDVVEGEETRSGTGSEAGSDASEEGESGDDIAAD